MYLTSPIICQKPYISYMASDQSQDNILLSNDTTCVKRCLNKYKYTGVHFPTLYLTQSAHSRGVLL